jgi:hypothetical protein
MAWLKSLGVAIFLGCWIISRPRHSQVTITDIFVLALLVIFLPYFLFNPSAITTFNTTPFEAKAVATSQQAFIAFLAAGSIVFLIRWRIGTAAPNSRIDVGDQITSRASLIASAAAVLIFIALLFFQEFVGFRLDTLRWITGEIAGQQYRSLRQLFSGGLLLDGVLGRLRYSLFPILFLLMLVPLIYRGSAVRSAIIAVLFFVALPLSFAKLPFIYFAGYLFLLVVLAKVERFTLSTAAIASCVGIVSTVLLISILYTFQYRGANGYAFIFDQPISLAFDRIWGESYSIILRYISVYPDQLPFAGFQGINLSAKLLGLAFRNPDLEVATTLLGPDSGSNPGIFFLIGYAAFGFGGVIVFSVAGFVLLWILDEIDNRLRTELCHQVYFSVMAMNCLFLLQLAFQTTLLSYGLAIVPVLMWGLDRVVLTADTAHGATEPG